MNLKNILCYKYKRTVNRAHQVCFESEVYVIDPSDTGSLASKEVMIHKYQDDSIALFYAGRRLPFDRQRKTVKNGKEAARNGLK